MADSFKISNILEKNYYKKLKRSKITKLFKRLNILNTNNCKKCYLKYLCGGPCPAILYNLYGKFNTYSKEWCQILEKETINIFHKTKFNLLQ